MSDPLFPDAEAHVIDANLFVAFERHGTTARLERAVSDHGLTLLCPARVYDELTPEEYPYDVPPIDAAVDAGWVEVLDEVDYTNPVVSQTMDLVRRYIAAATDRPEHDIEQADAEVGGATAMLLDSGRASSVAVYTNDLAAFRGIERAVTDHGYENRVQLIKAFDFVDAVENRYQFQG